MNVIDTIKEILAKRVDVSKLKPEDSLASLGLDSLDLVEVMLEIEYALHIEFTSEEITNLTNIQSVIDLINAKLA